MRTLGGCQESDFVNGFFCVGRMQRSDCRSVLVEHEIQVIQCVNAIDHFLGPHKLSRHLDAQMEYLFAQHGLQELAN